MALLLTDARVGSASPVTASVVPVRRSGRLGLALVYLFILSLILPIILMIGPIRLSPYRIVLICAFFPIVYAIGTGSWRLRTPDIFVMLYALWPVVSIVWHHGVAGGLEPAGIHVIESFGAYGLARCYIRSLADFARVMKVFVAVLAALVPIALYEAFTGHLILRSIFGVVFDTFSGANREMRLGLQRAHGPFEHSILFGVFCASMFGILVFAQGGANRLARRAAVGLVVITVTFLSLSAGPMVALVVQVGMVGWFIAMRFVPYKWWLAVGLGIAAYLVVDLMSNRTPFQVLISYATFNQANAYNRVHIWNFGIAEVYRHPILGIGFNAWQNGWWMSQSMDNFWLLTSVRFGVPAFVCLALAILTGVIKLAGLKGLSRQEEAVRTGWAISLVGVLVAGGTVHLWNAVFSHFFLLLGSVMWLLDRPAGTGPAIGPQRSVGDGGSSTSQTRAREHQTGYLLPSPPGSVLSEGARDKAFLLVTPPERASGGR